MPGEEKKPSDVNFDRDAGDEGDRDGEDARNDQGDNMRSPQRALSAAFTPRYSSLKSEVV
jgi:hypothetical protein